MGTAQSRGKTAPASDPPISGIPLPHMRDRDNPRANLWRGGELPRQAQASSFVPATSTRRPPNYSASTTGLSRERHCGTDGISRSTAECEKEYLPRRPKQYSAGYTTQTCRPPGCCGSTTRSFAGVSPSRRLSDPSVRPGGLLGMHGISPSSRPSSPFTPSRSRRDRIEGALASFWSVPEGCRRQRGPPKLGGVGASVCSEGHGQATRHCDSTISVPLWADSRGHWIPSRMGIRRSDHEDWREPN